MSVNIEKAGLLANLLHNAGCVLDEIRNADPGQVDGGEGGEYTVDSWEVSEEEEPKPAKKEKSK